MQSRNVSGAKALLAQSSGPMARRKASSSASFRQTNRIIAEMKGTQMLRQLKDFFTTWGRTRRAVSRLRRFDDHLLDDIGVERRQIAARVAGRSGR